MADGSNASISSRRSSIWFKEATANGFASILRLERTRSSLGRRVYKRLRHGEFRILEVAKQPGSKPGSFNYACHLSTHSLNAFPNENGYAAVSYTWKDHARRWNDGQDLVNVMLHGHTLGSVSRIGPMISQLYQAGITRLWIDGLCINQKDVSERSRQVACMREIYSNATEVVVFLGSGSETTDLIFDFLNHESLRGVQMSKLHLQGLLEVVSNPYWQRAWIIQEVAVARNVMLFCGSKCTRWELLIQALSRWDVSEWALRISFGSQFPGREIEMIDEFRRERHGSLIEVLQKTRSSKATNSLDVVYAKLGLANDADMLVPRVTYNIEVATLFKAMVKRYIKTKHDLYIICLVRERRSGDIQLPSWVPDWTKSTNRYPLLRFFFSGWMNVAHEHFANMEVSFSGDLNELRARGLRLDTIGQCSAEGDGIPTAPASMFPSICRTALADHFVLPSQNGLETMPSEFVHLFASTASMLESEFAASMTGQSVGVTPDMTPLLSHKVEDKDLPSESYFWTRGDLSVSQTTWEFEKWYRVNRNVLIAGKTIAHWADAYLKISRNEHHQNLSTLGHFTTGGMERSLTNMGWSRKLVGTKAGRAALAPESILDDDLVCVLYGCPVPVILRRKLDHFVFIGECYVDDFMDETKVLKASSAHLGNTLFNLR